MANVFISHRGADASVAAKLATALRDQGHSVWLDAWEIHVGDSIVERINDGLENTAYLVLCYSDSGVTSPWMSREWMSTLSRQLSGAGVRLLPVRLTGSKAPAFIADIKYADLVANWDQGIRELMTAMN